MSVRIGVVGAGFIGRVHMQTFAEVDGAEVVGCTDAALELELAVAVAKQFAVPRVFENAEELISSPDVDAVVVAVPNRMHAPLTVAALEAGKHVLCEKPMALTGDPFACQSRSPRCSSSTLW
ncbi:MAG: Gfo/Idh/MocA family protein [Spirochaetota bacterium]